MQTHAIDVGPMMPDGEAIMLAMDLHVPTRPAARPVLLFATPGGGVTRAYFDLTDGADARFSFARAMTAAGHYVAAVDPIGVGGSTRPEDGFAVTTELSAEANLRLLAILRRRIAGGELASDMPRDMPVIGTGHSAGALITICADAQGEGRTFDALLLFCCSEAGLPDQLDEEQIAALATPDRGRSRIADFARRRFAGEAYLPVPSRDTDTPAARALRAVHDRVVATVGVHAMTPGSVREEMAEIAVPVLLAVGDRDITGPPHLLSQWYRRCPDLTLVVLETSGHHVFVAPGAEALFARVAHWLEWIARSRDETAGEGRREAA